ncbi:MAG: nucleotidyltransferase family protein [Anaerolineales bacterium]|nr:nucleotidyltransferase family protein [Anaerolineales bacterium]NUQ86049.1 NTP transferase domain-containing protein [Anaerolineales bacterium]
MDAIVLAGGIPQPDDPLYTYSNGDAKALIDVAGKPMIQWVLDALGDSEQVRNVIVIGLSPKSGVTCKKPVYFLSNQGRMLANIVAGVNKALELDRKTQYVLVVSSDIPALKPEMVDWLVDACMETKDDLYYGICPREVMEARFPGSRRTYTRLKDIELCGADINITHVRMATEHLDLWEALIGTRKSPLRQASIIGLGTLFQVVTRSITLEDLVEKVSKRIGIQGRVIVWQHAEPCMDVDKPHQLEILRADLEKQRRKLASKAGSRKRAAAKKADSKKAKTSKTRTAGTKAAAKAKPKGK